MILGQNVRQRRLCDGRKVTLQFDINYLGSYLIVSSAFFFPLHVLEIGGDEECRRDDDREDVKTRMENQHYPSKDIESDKLEKDLTHSRSIAETETLRGERDFEPEQENDLTWRSSAESESLLLFDWQMMNTNLILRLLIILSKARDRAALFNEIGIAYNTSGKPDHVSAVAGLDVRSLSSWKNVCPEGYDFLEKTKYTEICILRYPQLSNSMDMWHSTLESQQRLMIKLNQVA
ncbi:hypothetical protein PCANC_08879 [Puccinia coronata f. sp. avenae]|uniref:Uncharacterized protein n=1 Tax=Puccinia coronata f. sp. avenae TaxID=200324 RepID=A0A2N5VS36_9BASI|nr:hypothetical protein PCANC_08879 [Puccinia coronata f. sp. avenae]